MTLPWIPVPSISWVSHGTGARAPRYALKRVRKNQGKIPVEVKRTLAAGLGPHGASGGSSISGVENVEYVNQWDMLVGVTHSEVHPQAKG